ncbi:hypothetical protein [Sulfolobus acidocaldarius]|uniref:Conserved protein n=4 Tax=Sulfolobus acidocaldarius TaxID=2285 RepID=Q4JA51_SULAC|nr:hypothetical protein [Sulfolobus acidocaldarius]AAY80329.1 conserved protein [Sulfolobus acidocaldarius DSM 639]AGE70910.1 hypothetical protein SacN8_04695 [Sulfolobus acidocaldarius N8]AGE73181.1 hypothetical protein SacRon12I_04685 [Sulfolobus acidocaldarius Ron12/I]ALU28783.1 hypothetical protein ATY89_01610 [Sulfolobus acidocaldarius]ALU31503.1 hypothetical protein ATZ20_04645 [Sulfolobus acidocaldarius]
MYHVRILEELRQEYDLTDDEIEYAIDKARGIILGFAMEMKAMKVLQDMNFMNVKYVDLPTHDIEAEKDGSKYYVEVKATKKSPTREYSAHKIAMIARLDGTHLTLVMTPSPHLFNTEEVLSEPKRLLFNVFRYIYSNNVEKLKEITSDDKYKTILSSYEKVIKIYTTRYNKDALSLLETFL